ncbi:MAG: hypothetical protein LKF88_02500 [Microbacteriaceae bacterium]|nr:hypothetical protein [Microbacteriaceae bacterium]
MDDAADGLFDPAGGLGLLVVVDGDLDALKHGLVESLLLGFGALVVERAGVFEQVEDLVEPVFNQVGAGVGTTDQPGGVGDLGFDAGLQRFEVPGWDGVVEEGLVELGLLSGEFLKSGLLLVDEGLVVFEHVLELLVQDGPELVDELVAEADVGVPDAADLVFDHLWAQVGKGAGPVAAGVPGQAEQVRVGATFAVGVAEADPGPAVSAE